MSEDIKAKRALKGLAPCRSKHHKCIYNDYCKAPQMCKYWRVMKEVRRKE